MATFQSTIQLNCSAESAFDFLIRTENIVRLAPDSAIEFVDPPEVLSAGVSLKVKATVYGMTYDISYGIVECSRAEKIKEVQTRGPLGKWQRETSIETAENGCTLTDSIEFEPPGGLAGFVMTEAKIRQSLESSYEFRNQTLQQLLGAE